jgi:lysophospholipase L1-like esterase
MRRWGHLACMLGLAAATLAVGAQQSTTETKAVEQPKLTASGHPDNDYWRQHDHQLLFDFAWLARFHDEDIQLGPPKEGEQRVVFMGDSITQGWNLAKSFPGKPYINRGISGQTTPQMLVRFRQDVIDLKPKAVVILAGTNDIAGNTGPETIEQIEENLASMADLANANGIKVVLCSILPAYDYPWQPKTYPAHEIDVINAWMRDYTREKGYIYVDFHTAMKDDRDGLPPDLSKDGVHPLPAGFAIMSKLAEAGIEKALTE